MDGQRKVTGPVTQGYRRALAMSLACTLLATLPCAGASAQANHPMIQGRPSGAGLPRAPGTLHSSIKFHVGQRNVKSVLIERDTAWLGTSGGLVRYRTEDNKYTRYDNKSGLLSNGVFYVGRVRGELWVGTYGGGLSIFDAAADAWRNYNIPDGMADAFVYDVLEASNGDIWIATWSGANRILGGRLDDIASWQTYTVENTDGGLPNDWVYGLAEGANGEIWLATEGGLARFIDAKWVNWRHDDGLGASFERVSGDIQFQNDPAQFSSHHARQKAEQGLQDVKVAYNPNYVISLLVTPSGEVWAGTWGGGLSRFDGKRWQTYTVRDGLPGNHVFALDLDSNHRIWVGTSSGLAMFDGANFVHYDRLDGLYSDVVFSIGFGPDGSAWVGGTGGLSWFPRGIPTKS